MMESYRAFPEPCKTMKIVFDKNIERIPKKSNQTLIFHVKLPVDFTLIKEEKVKQLYLVNYLSNVFQDFTWESLWGNAGGYIGFFLGISVMQLPQIVMEMFNHLNTDQLVQNIKK